MTTEVLADYQAALASLDELLDALDRELRAARAARPNGPDTLAPLFGSVGPAAEAVRGAVAGLADAAGEPAPQWEDRDGLNAVVGRLAQRIQERQATHWRRRLEEVAAALAAGRVVSRRTRRVVSALDELRNAAAADAARVAAGEAPLALPGPADGPWLDWVWRQPGDGLEAVLAPLRGPAPELYTFLLDVNPDDWQEEAAIPASPAPPTAPATSAAPAAAGPSMADPAPAEPPAPAPGPVSPEAAPAPPDPEATAPLPSEQPAVPSAPAPDVGSALPPSPAAPPARPPAPAAEPTLPPAPEPALADAKEIADRCAGGDYLPAVLLAAARAFGGLPEVDPRFDALLVSHHVSKKSLVVPWPDWCYDQDVAERMCRTAPESVRLAFLAAQCQLHGPDGGAEPPPRPLAEKGVEAFNDVPEIRNWLAAFLEAAAVPGLWEQVCRPAQPDPAVEYRRRRKEFAERYESGSLHRNDKAAYIHRQDHFLSRQPASKVLYEHLQPSKPGAAPAEARRQIASFLEKRPEALADEWYASTQRSSGKIVLRGGQRADLVRGAAQYLELAGRAWRAAETVLRAPPQTGDVERRRNKLRDLLDPARARAEGRPWRALFHQLAGGLSQ